MINKKRDSETYIPESLSFPSTDSLLGKKSIEDQA